MPFVIAMLSAKLLLPCSKIGGGEQDRNDDDVGAQHRAETDIGNAAKGARDVDSDLRARRGESDERATGRDGEPPLAAQLLQRVG